MGNGKRRPIDFEALRRLREGMVGEGAKVRAARKRRKWTQLKLAEKLGLSQSAVSDVELGDGATLSLLAWQRVGSVLGLPLKFELGRDALELPQDAGHADMQELILRLGRVNGRPRTFELATKPAAPAHSTDVGLFDDTQHALIQVECWNTFGNIGDAARSSDRKRSEAEAFAISVGHGAPYTVHLCWVVRATRRNRALVARYPELFTSRFPGSSRAWVECLTKGASPPPTPGLVWCDVATTRLFAWRSRGERRVAECLAGTLTGRERSGHEFEIGPVDGRRRQSARGDLDRFSVGEGRIVGNRIYPDDEAVRRVAGAR